MAEWLAAFMSPEVAIFIGGLVVAGGVIIKFWKPVKKFFTGISSFLNSWNGTPEVKDWSGAVIEPARPGVIAQIEVLRDQLQNSHQNSDTPNLRVDLDTKASKDDVQVIADLVASMSAKLSEHIEISKSKDAEQEETAQQVRQLSARWAPTE